VRQALARRDDQDSRAEFAAGRQPVLRGRELWSQIKPGDRLTLVREADNRHDRKAVRVEWNGHQLGYVPRAENRAVARALDAGEKLEARVSRLREDPDPWRRVEFEVFLIL
jgi:hypothetical protein